MYTNSTDNYLNLLLKLGCIVVDSTNILNTNNKVMKETNETFDYEIALPGLIREDLDIKAIFEKDFLTVFVNVKKDYIFVPEQSIRIVKLVTEVSCEKEDIIVKMENGVLTISLKKTNPITEITL